MAKKYEIKGVEIIMSDERAPNNPYETFAEMLRAKHGNEGTNYIIETLEDNSERKVV